jgi:hypothetical protein
VTEPTEQLGVDELRQQLRSLGYLDAGVNRFVLGPATDRRRPASIALPPRCVGHWPRSCSPLPPSG